MQVGLEVLLDLFKEIGAAAHDCANVALIQESGTATKQRALPL